MSDPSPERWRYTADYLTEVFGEEDADAAAIRTAAAAEGLPSISISADVGRFLRLLVRLVDCRRALEVGTLAGYSAYFIVGGMEPEGRLVTLEANPDHADLARRNFEAAGISERVRLVEGAALETLPALGEEFGPSSIDFVFIDAEKTEYLRYWELIRPMLRAGGLLVADNVLGTGGWWIDDEEHPERIAVDGFSRALVADDSLEVAGVLVRQGLLIARKI